MFFTSCEEKEPIIYNSRLYPVQKGPFLWEKESFFIGIPITLKLESRLDFDDPIYEGIFEGIKVETATLYANKEVYWENEIIEKESNLLSFEFAEIQTYQVERSGGYINDSYIIWINKNNSSKFSKNSGYYTFYFQAVTQNNHTINDSTVVFYRN